MKIRTSAKAPEEASFTNRETGEVRTFLKQRMLLTHPGNPDEPIIFQVSHYDGAEPYPISTEMEFPDDWITSDQNGRPQFNGRTRFVPKRAAANSATPLQKAG